MPSSDPLEWATEAVRLSAFPLNEDAALGTLHWELGVGSPPEAMNRQPQLPRVIEEGPWENGLLQVDSQRGQIHWRAFSRAANPDGPLNIGPFPRVTMSFRALMSQWLEMHCPSTNRIAFGVILMLPTASLQETAARLDGLLPAVSVTPDGGRDFVYRVNRRRSSQCSDGLEINRLATWSAVEGMGLEVVIVAGVPSVRPATTMSFCRLELDVNTVPIPDQEIPRKALPAVFGELVDAATEIAGEGDVP